MVELFGITFVAVALASIPWSVLRREQVLWRSREVRRKSPHLDSVFRIMDSLAKLGTTAMEASKGMKRMGRAFGPRKFGRGVRTG